MLAVFSICGGFHSSRYYFCMDVQKIAPGYKNKYEVVLINKMKMRAFMGLVYFAGSPHEGAKNIRILIGGELRHPVICC